MAGLTDATEQIVDTPFGAPSAPYVLGRIEGVPVAFLARHGRGHRLLPSEINYRANVFGLKLLGVDAIISASAVGSMKERYQPMNIVLPHQFIDRTRHRADTFFGDGLAAHVSFADPVCVSLSFALGEAARRGGLGGSTHLGGTYLCMEGPQFSTRAESLLYRSWDVDVIGMTNLTEAKLAREAEICYATMALVTDYDCWHEEEEDVTVETVLEYLKKNSEHAASIIRTAVPIVAERDKPCECHSALKFAIITDRSAITAEAKQRLAPLVGKYLR
jgi:5'-methylthioadenosine phosphorylase